MIRLNLLELVELWASDGHEIRSVLAGPKRVALLAYLALAGGFVRRDTLLSLFWPESDAEHARNSLRNAVHVLRRGLGEDVVISRGSEEIGLSDALWCDAAALDAALAEGRTEEALGLYRGEFLAGFHLDDAPEFERWVDAQRMRLRALAVTAASELSVRAEAGGNAEEAVRWVRRAVQIVPHDETTVRRLIQLLGALGERTRALEAYETLARELDEGFGLEPAPETRAAVEALRTPLPDQPPLPSPPPRPAAAPATAQAPPAAPRMPAHPRRHLPAQPTRLLIGAFAFALLIAAAAAWLGRDPVPAERVDPGLIAVLPFRVGGADPSLAYLREGMVDLIAATLGESGALRAVDPRSVFGNWRGEARPAEGGLTPAEARRFARGLGAGRFILGETVGSSDHIILAASLVDVASGATTATVRVQGPPDSLVVLSRRLVSGLLADATGPPGRETALARASLPALRAYLEGQAAYRRGRYETAARHFLHALDADSIFAPAAVGLITAARFTRTPQLQKQGENWAWKLIDQLSPRDSILVVAMRGPKGAEWSWRENLDLWARVLELGPDRAEGWYEYGDILYHWGAALGMSQHRERAHSAFERAVELSPSFAPALAHLVEIAARSGKVAEMRRLHALYLARDSAGDDTDYLAWRTGVALGDERTLERWWNHAGDVPTAVLWRIAGASQIDGIAIPDAERAAALLQRRSGTPTERHVSLAIAHNLAVNEGKPGEAHRIAGEFAALARLDGHADLYLDVMDALYAEGDPAAADRAATLLARYTALPVPDSTHARYVYANDLCWLAEWDLARGRPKAAERDALRMERVRPERRLCPVAVEASLAARQNRPDARARIARLDSILRTGPPIWSDRMRPNFNLVLARLLEARGDPRGALAALRRRPEQWGQMLYLSTFLREEGRLAALTGDQAGAIRAYRHYLALRAHPEPAVRPAVQQVRRELDRLVREAKG